MGLVLGKNQLNSMQEFPFQMRKIVQIKYFADILEKIVIELSNRTTCYCVWGIAPRT